MPFSERSIMSDREEFCRLALQAGSNRRELCRRFGVSPATGYKWLGRYRRLGPSGLVDQSRRPHESPSRSRAVLEEAVAGGALAHPVWGGRKIAGCCATGLGGRAGGLDGDGDPAAAGRLDWARAAAAARLDAASSSAAPNDLWQMDFKGHVALAGGPAASADRARRSLALCAGAVRPAATSRTTTVKARLDRGLPALRPALAHAHRQRLALGRRAGQPVRRSGVWLIELDIGLIHGRPYHPQTRARTSASTARSRPRCWPVAAFADLAEAEAAFERWREVYNTEPAARGARPRRAGQPLSASPRDMPRPSRPSTTRQATSCAASSRAATSASSAALAVPKAFRGKPVALRPTEHDGVFDVVFRTRRSQPRPPAPRPHAEGVHDVSEHLSTMSPV